MFTSGEILLLLVVVYLIVSLSIAQTLYNKKAKEAEQAKDPEDKAHDEGT